MKFPIQLGKQKEGEIIRVGDDAWDKKHYAWIDVLVGTEVIRLMVTQRFKQENDLYAGETFSWTDWGVLNGIINQIQDVTKLSPPPERQIQNIE